MSEYLTKEEERQWRSSLERITLEEYALRLGKKINTNKETHDLADAVLNNFDKVASAKEESLEIVPILINPVIIKEEKPIVEIVKTTEIVEISEKKPGLNVSVEFKKALTDREQSVFDYFAQNKGKTVFAKDLASLLDLPRDYVYKYIKNLRSKLVIDVLENSEKGGYKLNV
ncbi:MAG: helix-turn-helix domain-containing protein [Candidatus Gastranaerophilales bacterium]|nr:helix-turn-helix domain-containing protein [Candidatus Gastranaerophilales bacterium]